MSLVRDFRRAAIKFIASSTDEDELDGPPVGELRLMGDTGAVIPLWDEEGLLTDNPAYARRLGLSDQTLVDLIAWGLSFDGCSGSQDYVDFGRDVFDRVRAELDPAIDIRFVE